MQVPEQVLVHAGAGPADRGGGDRLRLRQRDAGPPAPLPQLGRHGGAAFPSARQHQAEDEQHDDEAVRHPASLQPFPVVAGGDAGGRVGDPGPHRDEAAVGGGRRGLAAALRLRLRFRLSLQDPAELRVERPDQDLLGRLGAAPAALAGGHADPLPAGGPVAGAVEAGRVDEGLAQDRAAGVPLLPSVGEGAQRHRQRLRRKVVDADPWHHQEAAVRHREVQPAVAVGRAPPDPLVPGRQRPRRRLEQQHREVPPAAVADEPADGRPEGPRAYQPITLDSVSFPFGSRRPGPAWPAWPGS